MKRLTAPDGQARATKIKAALWAGDDLATIAKRFSCGKSVVVLIKYGRRWPDALWPDGKSGAMPEMREQFILRQRARLETQLGKDLREALAAK